MSWSSTGSPTGPRPRDPAAARAVGLMKASRPSPSTVITPERMLRRMSSASSRTRLSSVASVACSIPASRSRCPSTATMANTTLKTAPGPRTANPGPPPAQQRIAQELAGREHRREGARGRRHDQRVGRHHQDVERGEGRLRLPREVHHRGDHPQVHHRLDQQEGVAGLAALQVHHPRPVGGEGQGDHHRDAHQERFLGTLGPHQPGAHQHPDGQNQAADEEPGEQSPLVRKRAPACPLIGWHRTSGCGLVEGTRRR